MAQDYCNVKSNVNLLHQIYLVSIQKKKKKTIKQNKQKALTHPFDPFEEQSPDLPIWPIWRASPNYIDMIHIIVIQSWMSTFYIKST